MEEAENLGALIACTVKHIESFAIKNKILYIYNADSGCYEKCEQENFAVKFNSFLRKKIKLKIKTSEYREAYQQLLLSHDLYKKWKFFENGPYVNCLNGVVDILNGELLPHSKNYRFKHCIHANYDPNAQCHKFSNYIQQITNGDEELTILLRTILGYLFSHYTNAKKAFLIYSQPHTGKSVLCRICEKIIGTEYVSHVDLSMLQRQEYAASLAGKLLNVAPDLKNIPLKDVGFFKSLVSHNDTIATRALYSNPASLRGEAKMLFSSNHLLQFDSTVEENDIKSVFQRLIFFPFQNDEISENVENKHLSEELYEERDAIFTWAMEGLRQYIENGETFPIAKLSENVKKKNIAQYCPEKVFFDLCIKESADKFESSSAIKAAYNIFCSDLDIQNTKNICRYIEHNLGIKKLKKRIDANGRIISVGSPIHVYSGIRLKKKARNYFLKGEDCETAEVGDLWNER